MAANDLNRRRAEVLKLQQSAGRKVNRNRAKGVELAGTRHDPRRDADKVKRYTAKQLDAYEQQLTRFMDRKTQFVPDSAGRPIEAAKWRTYKNLENRYKAKSAKQFDQVKDKVIPGTSETFGQRLAKMMPDHRQMAATDTPFKPPNRSPKNVADEKKLKKLTAQMRARVEKDYDAKVNRRNRNTTAKMIKEMGLGSSQFGKNVKTLTPKQFALAWLSGLMDKLSLPYHIAKATLSPGQQAANDEVYATQLKSAEKLVEEIKKLDLGE